MAQALVTFPGITQTMGGLITNVRGPFPAAALVYFVPQTTLDLSVGDLVFTYDSDTVTFPNCRPELATLRVHKTSKGYLHSILIYDRRKSWENSKITGDYNQRRLDGSIKNSASLQSLASTLLTACGETNVDVSALPATVYPEVHWNGDNPALELDRLCQDAGCEIVVNEYTTEIVSRGSGSALPAENDRRISPIYSFTPAAGPQTFTVEGGDVIVQGKLKLEATGEELTGQVNAIADLAYKPSDGWSKQHPWLMQDVSTTAREHAKRSVWRMYRVSGMADGTLEVPGVGTVSSAQQIKILPHQAQYDGDHPYTAVVEGTYWNRSECYENTDDCEPYNGQYALDLENGMVIFQDFVLKLDSDGCYEEAELYLQTAFKVEADSGQMYRYSYTTDKNGAVTAPLASSNRVISRPELFESIELQYTACDVFANPAYETNLTTINSEASAWTAAMAAEFNTVQDQRTLLYEGVKKVDLDGRIAQATYDISMLKDKFAKTTASEMFEHDTNVESAGTRRARREALR